MIPNIGEEILIPAKTNYTIRNIGNEIAELYIGYGSNKSLSK